MTGFIFAMMTKRLEVDSLLEQAASKKVEIEEEKKQGVSGKGTRGKGSKKKGAADVDEVQVVVV